MENTAYERNQHHRKHHNHNKNDKYDPSRIHHRNTNSTQPKPQH